MIYYPQIKTTTAELCAYKELIHKADDKKIVPILQLTKPRLAKTLDSLKSLDNHLEKIFKEKLSEKKKIILDVTEDETYQDANLSQFFHDSSDGYIAWIKFLSRIKKEYNSAIIPSIVGRASAQTLPELKKQIQAVLDNFSSASIRLPIKAGEDFTKLKQIIDILDIQSELKRINIIYDFNYVKTWASISHTVHDLNDYLANQNWGSTNIVLLSSCHSNFQIEERSDSHISKYKMVEPEAFLALKGLDALSYGDYGYIHPKRNDGAGFWLPRVDYPAQDGFCYYIRSFNRKTHRVSGKLKVETTTPNDVAYKDLCEKIAKKGFYTNDTLVSWGRSQIGNNALSPAKDISGKSPQHYIAVRSNIHMERVIGGEYYSTDTANNTDPLT